MTEYQHRPITLDSKVAVVIGGTSGIGRAIALGFATEGANVVATSRSADKVKQVSNELRSIGSKTVECPCDVTKRSSLEELKARTIESVGVPDVIVASQGAISRASLAEIDESQWNRVLDVNLNGTYRTIQTFAQDMDGGSIVVISSLAARLSLDHASAYSAAKGGIQALTRAAAKELAPDIRVNAIAPGFVITPQNEDEYAEGTDKRERIRQRTPLGRVAEREEIVGGAVYLASPASSYTTGEVLTIDGGFARSSL